MNCSCGSENCIIIDGKMGRSHFGGRRFGKHFSDTVRNKQVIEDENLKILVELPGIDKSDMKISAKSDKLVINAKYKEELDKFYPNSSVNRSIQLIENVDPATSSAKYADGVLVITFQLENQKTEVPID